MTVLHMPGTPLPLSVFPAPEGRQTRLGGWRAAGRLRWQGQLLVARGRMGISLANWSQCPLLPRRGRWAYLVLRSPRATADLGVGSAYQFSHGRVTALPGE